VRIIALAKIAAILDMYRNFFAVLVWHRCGFASASETFNPCHPEWA
jgi:hypothetical protein